MCKRFILFIIAIGFQYTECSTVARVTSRLLPKRQSSSQAPVKPQRLTPPQQIQPFNNNLQTPDAYLVIQQQLNLEPQSLDLMNTEEKYMSLFKDKLGRLGRANLTYPPRNDTNLIPQIRFAFTFEGDKLILDKQRTTIMHYELNPQIAANLIGFIKSLGYSSDVQKKIFEDIKNTVKDLVEIKNTMNGATSVNGATFESTKKMIINALENLMCEKTRE